MASRFRDQVSQQWGQGGGFGAFASGLNNPKQSKPDFNAALGEVHPALPAAWETAKWAFRGTRTTQTHSLAREQNVYGGVQRDSIPTERITTWNRRSPTMEQQHRRSERTMLDYQELTLPEGGHMGGGFGSPAATMGPTAATMGGEPFSPLANEPERYQDPLFSQNTGNAPYNAAQFGNVHQRATAGGPRQQ